MPIVIYTTSIGLMRISSFNFPLQKPSADSAQDERNAAKTCRWVRRWGSNVYMYSMWVWVGVDVCKCSLLGVSMRFTLRIQLVA